MERWEKESPLGDLAKFCGKNSTALKAQTGRGGSGKEQEATGKITCLKAGSSLSPPFPKPRLGQLPLPPPPNTSSPFPIHRLLLFL